MEDHATIDVVVNSSHASGSNLTVRVVTPDGDEIYFKCKSTTPLQKLMTAFCNRQGVSPDSVRFVFDDKPIGPNQTPQELEMEDGDDIFVEYV